MRESMETELAGMTPAGRAAYLQIKGLVRDGLLYRVDKVIEACRQYIPPESIEACRQAMIDAIKRDPVVN